MMDYLFTNSKPQKRKNKRHLHTWRNRIVVKQSFTDYLPNNDAASSSEAGSGTPAAPPKPAPDCPPFLSPPFLSPSLSIFPILTQVCVRADDNDADDDDYNTLPKTPDLLLLNWEERESATTRFCAILPFCWTAPACDYTWFLQLLPSPYVTFLDTFLGLFFSGYFYRPRAIYFSTETSYFFPAGFSFTYT